jgi:hypothetical protein
LLPLFATGVNDTGGKYKGNWWQNLPLVSLIPVANLPPVSLIPAQFATGVVDTGGKFATGIVDTGGAP